MRAAIDAGSNTLRLLVGRTGGGKVLPDFYLRRICRLAGGFTNDEGLSPEAMERTLFAFQEFAQICREHAVREVRAVGTAAFRMAVNGEDFAREVRSRTQLPLEIITGEEEADMMTLGVHSALDPIPANALIVDIGGGSTEFVLCSARKILWRQSLPLGVVRLVEGAVNSQARRSAIASALTKMSEDLEKVCVSNAVETESIRLVGTAGTFTTLAALDQQMSYYDWKRINNYEMSLAKLLTWHDVLEPLSPLERESLPGMEAGRGDLILAGIELILCLMQTLKITSLTVSDFGILEGLLLSLKNLE